MNHDGLERHLEEQQDTLFGIQDVRMIGDLFIDGISGVCHDRRPILMFEALSRLTDHLALIENLSQADPDQIHLGDARISVLPKYNISKSALDLNHQRNY